MPEINYIRTMIIDDHYLLRDGLKAMLASFKKELSFEIHEAESGEKALQKLEHLDVDLVIVDYQMEGLSGPETARRILRFKPHTRILALSSYAEYPCIEAMLDAGASGYLLKNVEPAQMLLAIRHILAGKKYFSNEIALALLEAPGHDSLERTMAKYKLTWRELEVLQLIAEGLKNAAIAAKLSLGRRTVDTHRQNLLVKIKVVNTAALIQRAHELGLLK